MKKFVGISCGLIFLLAPFFSPTYAEVIPLTYYVDCINGVDTNTGTSPSFAWKTLSKANSASLTPGDKLLLKKDCIWTGPLTAKWNGTAEKPITIGAYGTGTMDPLIEYNLQNTVASRINVDISGSYQIIDHVRSSLLNLKKDPNCLDTNGQPTPAGWYVGFSISGHHNTIQNSEVYGMAVGINTTDDSHHNKVVNNYIHDLKSFWGSIEEGALGAVGVNLHGDDSEYAFNKFEHNIVSCTLQTSQTTRLYSTPFEVFNADRNHVHHNQAFGHRKHFEMGHSSTQTTDDNIVAYNLFTSDFPEAKGPTIHGNDEFGPVNRTQIYNNTIVMTGALSTALSCGCSGGAVVKNNIFIGEEKAAFYAGTFTESHNIYWDYRKTTDSPTDPFVQFFTGAVNTTTGAASLATTSTKTDPLLDDPFGSILPNFAPTDQSPAVNTAAALSYTEDLYHGQVPIGSGVDRGAIEHLSVPVPTGPQIAGDMDKDCLISSADLSILLAAFGMQHEFYDLNGDTRVTIADLSLLLSNFGKRCS